MNNYDSAIYTMLNKGICHRLDLLQVGLFYKEDQLFEDVFPIQMYPKYYKNGKLINADEFLEMIKK